LATCSEGKIHPDVAALLAQGYATFDY